MAADRPLLVGLTGSIGMGKSETAKMFARLGVPVYDADAAVHALYEPGGGAVGKIAEAFPGSVRDGRVDRAELSRQVGGDAAAFAKLEAIVHPLVAAAQRAFIDRARAGGADLIVLDIPLLFETGGDARMDAVVVVSAPQETQRERVLSRQGMTPDKLDRILARQMPDAEKRAKAHFVVETGEGLDHAFAQVRKIVMELRARRAETT
ncbi:MAG: dephospho-CoA kinase [Alphaproteobacteria bacterium]|nr:dephospho-CoA kinase [Alphaproteobacteria bacterium]MDE2109634.1 dephospho-CoA kinase [Alphaproteobacteria bacterium]MDE2493054.1 dephospho-CoA kinase [Alphaproteobacteria bacterium]